MAKNVEFTYDIYVGAPVAKVWKGIVDGEMTKHYVYGTRLQSKLKKGAPYAYVGDGEFKVVDGEIVEIEPEKRLVMSYELSATGPSTTRLHLVHDDFDGETATYSGSVDSWPLMMSSLKSLLETGKPLATK